MRGSTRCGSRAGPMKRTWLWLALLALGVVFAPSFAFAYPPSPSFFDNEKGLNHFWVTDPQFGGKCDNITDDHAAIVAANTAALTFGGQVWFPGGLTCANGSTIVLNAPTTWIADGQATIQAKSSMESLVDVTSVTGGSFDGSQFSTFRNITFDAHNLATSAMRRIGDFNSKYENCRWIGSARDGSLAVRQSVGSTISAITLSGGASAGALTVTQREANYNPVESNGNYAAKIVGSGGLGTATYALSDDGGSTYPTVTQTVFANSNPIIASAATPLFDSGLRFAWLSRTYSSGEIYAFTTTPPTEIGGSSASTLNVNAKFYDGEWTNNGTAFYSGSVVNFASAINTETAVSGTCTTNGTQQVVCAGTSLLATGAREGDFFFLETSSGTGPSYSIAAVLDDTHLTLSRGQVVGSASSKPFAVIVGAGYEEYAADQNILSQFYGGKASKDGTAWRFAGARGPTMIQPYVGGCAIANWSFGTPALSNTQGAVLVHPYWEDNAISGPNGVTLYVDGQFASGAVVVDEPLSPFAQNTYGNGPWFTTQQNTRFSAGGAGTAELVSALTMQSLDDFVSSSTFQFPPPSFAGVLSGPSLHYAFLLSGSIVLSGTSQPILPPLGGIDGQVITIANGSGIVGGAQDLTFPGAGNNLRNPGGSDVIVKSRQSITYASDQGVWEYISGGEVQAAPNIDLPAHDVVVSQGANTPAVGVGTCSTGQALVCNSNGTADPSFQTITSGVSSVTGAGGSFSCPTTTGAASCVLGTTGVTATTYGDATHVMSCAVNAEGQATSCSNVAISSVTLTSGSGISVTGGPAYNVALAVPVAAANGGTGVVSPTAHGVAISEGAAPFNFVPAGATGVALVDMGPSADPAFSTVLTVGGGTGLNTPGTSGNLLTSNGTNWVSSPNAASGLYRLVDRMIADYANLPIATWAHTARAGTTIGTVTQIGSDGAAWASILDPNSHIVSLPISSTTQTVFTFDGVNVGDQVDVTFQTDYQVDEPYRLILGVSVKAVGVTPTWPTDYVTSGFTAAIAPNSISGTYGHVTEELRLPASGASGRLWVQLASYDLATTTLIGTYVLTLNSEASIDVDIWRP